jgi:hypothetical protein
MKQYKLVNSRTKEETFCSKVVIDEFDYYVNDYISDEVNGDLTKIPFNKIILLSVATTNPNIDVPKVIDEIKELGIKEYGPIGIGLEKALCFKNGYNKSQETYPFSAEDVCEFVEWMNLHYRVLEHTLKFKNCSGTKQLLNLWEKEQIKTIYYED